MARTKQTVSIDEKIMDAQETVEKTKQKYDAAVKELRNLMEKKEALKKQELFLLLFVSGALWGIVNIGNLVGGLLCVWLIFVIGTRNKYKSLKEKLKNNISCNIIK